MSSVIPWFELPTLSLLGVSVDLPDLLAVAGVLLALAMSRRGARRAGLSPRRSVDALAVLMLSGLLFGRLAEVIYYPERLAERLSERLSIDWSILLPWRGGYASLGVFLGTGVALLVLARRCDPNLRWRYLDVLVPSVLAGGAVVRLGCFLGHHHAGRLAVMPGAVAYPGGARLDLGLCEATLLFALLGMLAVLARRRWKAGHRALLGVIAYAVGRFVLEFLRGFDLERIGRRSDARYVGLTLVQYAMLAMTGIALWVGLSSLRRLDRTS